MRLCVTSHVTRVTGYGLGDRVSIPDSGNNFLLTTVSISVPGLTQPPIQWVQGLKLTTHLLLVSRLRMRGALPPFLLTFRDMVLKHRDKQFDTC